jgi:hypothetical protein
MCFSKFSLWIESTTQKNFYRCEHSVVTSQGRLRQGEIQVMNQYLPQIFRNMIHA